MRIPRLPRLPLTALASALIFLLSLTLWTTSTIFSHDPTTGPLTFPRLHTRLTARTWHGKLVLDWDEIVTPPQRKIFGTEFHNFRQAPYAFDLRYAPDTIAPGFADPWARQGTLAFPLLALILPSALLPLIWVVRRYRRRRPAQGFPVSAATAPPPSPSTSPKLPNHSKSTKAAGDGALCTSPATPET